MDVSSFLRFITSQPEYNGQIVHDETILPRDASYGALDKPLNEELQDCLRAHRLYPFYTHQAEAINLARNGKNVMIATSSASGKSLCYNTAVVQTLLEAPLSRALYLFPTKALAQDQLRALREQFVPDLLKPEDLATFDGDTPAVERGEIRKKAKIILTNPDMLHVGILPNHANWSRLFRHLNFVIVDEAHSYRGIFGSHLADILRRLRRISKLYGGNPQFILSSATISNPGEHAEKLVGLPFEVVDNDGSPHGGKSFLFWNPPIIDEAKSTRRSSNSEATFLFTELVKKGIRSLTFARTRRLTELIYLYSRRTLSGTSAALAKRIKPYRAGYMPEERRKIEKELFNGELLGVVATTALEMGIDIGGLDATILTGYPGSIAATWQQAGRSGRGTDESLSFLIGLNGPLDQYFMRHPEAFFRKGYENALVNPANKYILRGHLMCAAWELPLTKNDEAYFGPDMNQEIEELAAQGILRERLYRWYLAPSIAYPAQAINIRSASGKNYAIIDTSTNSMMETLEDSAAFYQVHPGAVYLHQGETYLIEKLDLDNHIAYAKPSDANYYTQTKELTDIKINNILHNKRIGEIEVKLGEVEVTTKVTGYRKKVQYTEEIIGEEPLDLPPHHFQTVAFWFDLPLNAVAEVEEKEMDYPGGLHAAEHAAIGILPLFALCDRNDIGGVSTAYHADTGKAQIFIYDGYPGGIGIAEKGYELIKELWEATLKVVTECPCQDGCPSCIQSPKCGNNNKPLDKEAAKILLRGLTGRIK